MSKSPFGETLGTMIKCLMKSYYPSRPAYVIASCQWRLAVEIFSCITVEILLMETEKTWIKSSNKKRTLLNYSATNGAL